MSEKLPVHPAANLFPMMVKKEFAELVEDIRQHGQEEQIIVWRGQLLDGRNRLKACEQLGIQPNIGELDGDLDPVQYVLSHNLHRRHLTETQRSMVAAKLATLKRGRGLPTSPALLVPTLTSGCVFCPGRSETFRKVSHES